jgi:hypothetical protein
VTSDLKRLGKRGSYRLGRLRAQGISEPRTPAPMRVSFARPSHYGPVSLWLLAWLGGTAAVWGGAIAGLWYAPFVVGLAAGLANRFGGWRARVTIPAVALMAAAGWAAELAWMELHGESAKATAHVIAALLGLPAHAAVGIAVTLLIAVVQALVGLWLGRALTPRSSGD